MNVASKEHNLMPCVKITKESSRNKRGGIRVTQEKSTTLNVTMSSASSTEDLGITTTTTNK